MSSDDRLDAGVGYFGNSSDANNFDALTRVIDVKVYFNNDSDD